MAKETRKQIVEQTRQEVAKQYKAKIGELEKRCHRLSVAYNDEAKSRQRYQDMVIELQGKVNQYEDWIRRLQEYMDMEPDSREKALEQDRAKYELNKKVDDMLGIYTRIFNVF